MAAFAALRGLQNQVGHMFSSERLPFTAVYLGAMAGTLFFSLVRKVPAHCAAQR